MSFLKRLFGGGGEAASIAETPVGEPVAYKGFSIQATPYQADGQWQTCGVISKELDGERMEHRFVRADRLSTREEAASIAVRKGQQIIDEQGDMLFA